MRPIDKIRERIDSDLRKYKTTTMCKILSDDDVKCIRGIGMCARVSPLNPYNLNDPDTGGMEHTFTVFIINRPLGWFEKDISSKYYVKVLNTTQDSPGLSMGFLVPSTVIDDFDALDSSVDPDVSDGNQPGQMAHGDPHGIESYKFDYIMKGDMV